MKQIFLLLLIVSVPASARWLTKQESGSVIEAFIVHYDVLKDGASTQTVDYALRIQSEDAKANGSMFQIEYNAFTDKVEILEAYTQNGKQKIKVPPAAIEDRDKGEAKDYDVQKVRSVVFPQVQIGSRLFIKYKQITSKPIIAGRWSTSLTLSPSYFVEKFRMTVKSEVPLFYDVKDPGGYVTFTQATPKTFEVSNRKLLPGWVHAEKDPYFHPARSTEVWVSTHKDWSEFFSGLSKDYDTVLKQGVPSKLKDWVNTAKKKKTAADKIQYLMEKMSTDFRYFGDWRRHDGGLVPRKLEDIEQSRYGDCKDLSTLLVAMLRHVGLDARVGLIRRGDNPWGVEPDYPLPAINRFNHAIAYVKDGQNTYWLDPTNPVFSLKPYDDISGRPSWVLNASGGEFIRLPEVKPAEYQHVHEYEYRFDGDDTVKVKLNAKLMGLAAAEVANSLMLSSRSQVLSDSLEYFSEGQEVKNYKWLKEPQTGRVLKDMSAALEYEAGRVTFSAGKAQFWVLPDGFLQGAFYETEDRESDLNLAGAPYLFSGTRRLRDIKLMQEVPEPCKVQSEWMDLERTVRTDGRDVLITHRIDLKKPYIQKTEYKTAAFKKLQTDTKRCLYRSGVLVEPLNGRLSSAR